MTKFSNKFENLWFLAHSWGKNNFSKKSSSATHSTTWKKLISQSQENLWTEWWKDGRKDGQTLIHRTFPAMAGGPKNISALHPSCLIEHKPKPEE